tara:strand:+ start:222 stop:335 length:114 start_codon:yes stop_codon:yes gene_type:complete
MRKSKKISILKYNKYINGDFASSIAAAYFRIYKGWSQ